MSRSLAVQGRSRYGRTATWERAFCGHAARPARVLRRTARSEIQAAVDEVALSEHDPADLLHGAALPTWRDVHVRSSTRWRDLPCYDKWEAAWRDPHNYVLDDEDWRMWLGTTCGACDSGCACATERYAQDAYEDYLGYYEDVPNEMCSWWVSAWVDGRVEAPEERDSYDDLRWELPSWMVTEGEDWQWGDCSGCGEMRMHCEARLECDTLFRLPETADEYDARHAYLDALPGDLLADRDAERAVRRRRRVIARVG